MRRALFLAGALCFAPLATYAATWTIGTVGQTTATVPSDWNSALNQIHCLGAGAGGQSADGGFAGSGGQGGAYAQQEFHRSPVRFKTPLPKLPLRGLAGS